MIGQRAAVKAHLVEQAVEGCPGRSAAFVAMKALRTNRGACCANDHVELASLVESLVRVSAPVVDVDAALRAAMKTMSLKDAVRDVSATHDLPRRDVYQRALSLEDE